MSGHGAVDGRERRVPPPLAAEDHVCDECGLAYAAVSVQAALPVIGALPAAVGDAISAVPADALRRRPSTGGWSITEYVCHLRDVYATYTIRLHRSRTEDGPVVEPMFNDLRALRFRYNERDAALVLDELAATASGFCEEIGCIGHDEWDRVVTRPPGEQRTARWLVRQAMHEGRHHLADIRRTGASVSAPI
jgi:hypothetical protein